ncbi:MAG: hypothetical protein C0618_06740 [Desulfuromonas sp.]|nr:MAG: hypothetical protein C0618_06740 [Desulfuromonas sp.]
MEVHANRDGFYPLFVKSMLLGLMNQCPSGGNPHDCQFHSIRKATYVEQRDWLNSTSHDKRIKMYEDHLACKAARAS